MADEFQPGICSGGWWNTARSNIVASSMSHSSSAAVDASSGRGGGAFSWLGAEMARSGDDQPTGSASGSSITYQEAHHSDLMTSSILESSVQIPSFGVSASTMDWNQAILRSNGRAETSFQALLQDDMNSRTFFRQDQPINSDQVHAGETLANHFKDIDHTLKLDQHQLSSGNQSHDYNINSFTLAPTTSYGYPMQGLFESDNKSEQSIYHDNRSFLNNYQSPVLDYRPTLTEQLQPSWPNFSQSLHTSSSSEKELTNQLQFLSKTQYPEFTSQTFEQKRSCSSQTQKSIVSDSSSSIAKKRSGSSSSEPLFKKPRMEIPSPLPSFKVRKEKLGDRITALQQLVSPFGKTDTASVLHEAIEYIKFLHDQVIVLSNPYLKTGHPHHQQLQISHKSKDNEESNPDLRSRGLCLVPVASTYPDANQTPSDFWTPTFGGTYR